MQPVHIGTPAGKGKDTPACIKSIPIPGFEPSRIPFPGSTEGIVSQPDCVWRPLFRFAS